MSSAILCLASDLADLKARIEKILREEGMEHGKIKGRLMKVAELSNQEKLMAAGYKEA